MKKKLILIISIFFIGINMVFAKDKVTFSKCVDGDTFKVLLSDKEYTVRMLAIDTPESVHPTKGVEYYGKEASDFTCDKVTKAKTIELEYDDNSDKLDKYERLLAWVFVDGELLQQTLIEQGYAKVAYLYGDYKYTKMLQEKQELVEVSNVGIWNTQAKEAYESSLNVVNQETSTESTSYSRQDIIIMVILLLIIIFVGNKSIKNKATKKLKKYLS